MKNNDWGFLDLHGKKATGEQVLAFLKNALSLRIGYIYEYKRAYKYVGFSDIEDFTTWFEAVGETINSKNPEIIERNLSNPNIIEVWDLPKSGVGYIWEGQIEDGQDYYGKFFGFIDKDKYIEWVSEGRPTQSDLILQSWVSFRPRIVALEQSEQARNTLLALKIDEIERRAIGYVIEDHLKGKFLGFGSAEKAELYLQDPEQNSNLIIAQWNNSKEQGIPIYTRSYANSLVSVDPESYIEIPDDSDIEESSVENHTYDTSINGPLANILFSALRKLQSEVAKIKNTFNYGLHSYTGTDTAMSRVEHGYVDYEEDEPLWAIDEDELSLIKEVILGLFHTFDPSSNVDASEEGVLTFNSTGATWYDTGDISQVEDPKILIYLTTTGNEVQVRLVSEGNVITIDLEELGIPNLSLYDILIVISRTQTINNIEKGNLFIWISVNNRYTDETVAEGYFKNGVIYPTLQLLDKNYTFQGLFCKNLTLSKFKIYSKYLDFSRLVIPSKPSDEDYVYKVAHLTVRSIANYLTLNSIKDQLPENELIYIEDTNTLCIKNGYKLKLISGGTSPDKPDDPDNPDNPPIDTGMTQQETIQLLRLMGITTDELNNLNLSSDIVFIHQDTGTKFKLHIDSEGNLSTSEITNDTLAQRIKDAFGLDATSVGDDNKIRGFVGRLGLATQHVERASGESAMSELSDIKLYSDRIKIGQFYAPAKTNSVFGCSHCFVELENTSNKDFPLDNCYLHLACKVNTIPKVYHLALKGTIPAGGTFLIRGAKKAEFDDPNTFIKVTTFDQEWYDEGTLLDFSHNGEVVLDGANLIGNDPHGFALTYGNPVLSHDTQLWFSNSSAGDDKAPYLYDPSYIDAVYYNSTFNTGNSAYWTTKNERMYYINNGIFPDCIYKNTFELDPAKQAYQALNTYDSSRIRHANTADYQYLYLGKEFIEFPKTSERYPVSKFTPKASFEHKNVSTDKTQLDVEKPNMVTCSFGKNPYTTRCFNWVSGGLFDEYVFIKQGNDWIKFESYKEGDESKTLEEGALKRKEFNNADIINNIYKRMTGRFPAANTQYTSHKCIINVVESAVESPTEYTYIVGRANKNGTPDLDHCSEEYTFTLYPTSYTPRIYLITDQQGFHWVEYQAWAAAAEVVNELIIEETSQNNIIPILINTGDMTQSGSRINEWLDYYNAGKCLFSHLELMNVVGNNDLCGNDFTILGTGDDEGKANSYYFHVFYCFEVETEEGMIPIINNKYVPSLYRIMFDNHLLLAVNSEITSVNCRGWFNATYGNDVVNVYTGWTVPSSGSPQYVSSFTSIYTMIYNMTDNIGGREIIAICHEMPFTVITAENLENTSTIIGRWRSLSGASSLVGSHLNQISINDTVGTHWFSRLLEYRNCKLCIGGHKHTYAVTYPILENYIYGALSSKVNGPMTMNSTLLNDNIVTWVSEGRNLSKFPLTTRTLPAASSTSFYPSEHVESFYNDRKGVIYFMLQATGFKLMSNKELPSPDLTFSLYIPKSLITRDANTNKITKSSASPDLRYPMYAVIELGTTWDITLIRLANIQVNPTSLFTLIKHGTAATTKQYLYDNYESAGEGEWKYGGWSNEKRTLLQIS